jgi:hypothetical protein
MPAHSNHRTHEIEEDPAWGMYVEWQAPAPAPKPEAAAGSSRPRRSSRSKSIGVDKRASAISKKASKTPRGTGLYRTTGDDDAAPASPWKGLPVSNKFDALMSPEASPVQPAASLPELVPVSAMPAKAASPAKMQAHLTSDKENAGVAPVVRRTRAAVKILQQVVDAVVDAVLPGIKRSSRAAFACLPARIVEGVTSNELPALTNA